MDFPSVLSFALVLRLQLVCTSFTVYQIGGPGGGAYRKWRLHSSPKKGLGKTLACGPHRGLLSLRSDTSDLAGPEDCFNINSSPVYLGLEPPGIRHK